MATVVSQTSVAVAVPILGVAPWGDFWVHSVVREAGAETVGFWVSLMVNGPETLKKMFPIDESITRPWLFVRVLGRFVFSLPSFGVLASTSAKLPPLLLEKLMRTLGETDPPPTFQVIFCETPHSRLEPFAGKVTLNGATVTLICMSSQRVAPWLLRIVARKFMVRSTVGNTSNGSVVVPRTVENLGKVREAPAVGILERKSG